jgi:hypothetical protein
MRNVTPEQVAMAEQHRRGELPDRIEGALGELAGAAKEGLMALSVGVGLGVLHELMAAEVDEVVGPKGKHDRATAAPSATATSRPRYASALAGSWSAARACGRPTTARRSRSRRSRTSQTATRSRTSCSSHRPRKERIVEQTKSGSRIRSTGDLSDQGQGPLVGLEDRGPSSCSYSPECVELEFSEVHIQDPA